MTLLLTGATGFLGRHVLPRLLAAGHVVHTLGRRPPGPAEERRHDWTGDLGGSAPLPPLPWEEIDRIVHLAASGVKASHRAWNDALAVNVVGTATLLDAVERLALRRPPVLVTRTFYEDLIPEHPALAENPYIATKAAGSRLVRQWAARTGRPVTFASVFQVFGPGDDPGNVLSYAAARLAACEPATFGSGRGLRDWLPVDDAAAALASLAESGAPGTFDIGSGELRSIRDMIDSLARLAGAPADLLTFDPTCDRPDADLVRRAENPPPGWKTATPLDDALRSLLDSQG